MKDFLGYGRSRSSSGKGDVVKRHFNEYVNCLHAQVGTARENMEVLVAEFLEPIGCAMRGRNPENPSERGRSNGKYKQRIEMGSNISNTITSVQKDSLVAEPNVLTPKRTDFGKQVRKQYESGELDMSRHDMTELEPRTDGVSNTLTSVQKDNLVAEPIIIDDYNQRVPQDQDVIGTVTTQFGNPAPRHGYKIAEPLRIPQATKQGYIEVPQGAVFDMSYPESTTRRGRVQEGGQVSPTLMAGGETPCLFEGVAENTHIKEVAEELKQMATDARKEPIEVTINKYGSLRPHKLDKAKTGVSEFQVENEEDTASTLISARPNKTYGISTSYRIRKLTPRECFRLMGVTETDIDKIQQSGVSQSQQYKMAGNSIVVDCLYHMFRKLFTETACESQQLSLF